MRGPLPLFKLLPVLMLRPQAITSATVNGAWVDLKVVNANHLLVILLGGTFAAVANGRVRLQGRKKSDATAANILDKDGNPLAFTATALDDGGSLETSGILVGTFPLEWLDNDYDAVRVEVVEDGGAAMNVAGVGILCNLREEPSGVTDDLIAKVEPQFTLPT